MRRYKKVSKAPNIQFSYDGLKLLRYVSKDELSVLIDALINYADAARTKYCVNLPDAPALTGAAADAYETLTESISEGAFSYWSEVHNRTLNRLKSTNPDAYSEEVKEWDEWKNKINDLDNNSLSHLSIKKTVNSPSTDGQRTVDSPSPRDVNLDSIPEFGRLTDDRKKKIRDQIENGNVSHIVPYIKQAYKEQQEKEKAVPANQYSQRDYTEEDESFEDVMNNLMRI